MDKETYEAQRAFAGEKKASMKRRCVGHDYTRPATYMLTMTVEGRRPLLARVQGTSSKPHVELTPLGEAVSKDWWGIQSYYPQIEVLDLQMMPDHLHGILFVYEKLPCDLSRVVRGFKTGCGRAYRRLVAPLSVAPSLSVATESRHTMRHTISGSHPEHGLLFEPGFNDRILRNQEQLETWRRYLRDNPRRLLQKREHPDLFRVKRDITVGSVQFSAIGNTFLLQSPDRRQVQCSRRLTDSDIARRIDEALTTASHGTVFVSPSISKGEKAVMRAVFDAGYSVILLQENGYTDLSKPTGRLMDACASSQLLLLSPWQHHNEQIVISRGQCLSLNEMARVICEGG